MNRIAEVRNAKGWSQQRLAVEAGLHVQTVSEAEREYRGEPAEATWERIATALGVTVEQLKRAPKDGVAVAAAGDEGDPEVPAGTSQAAPPSHSGRRAS